jgi:hypothetical protein
MADIQLIEEMFSIERGIKVWDREGSEVGFATGGVAGCAMEGCHGVRVNVRWPDGELSKPCTTDMHERKDGGLQLDPR